MLSNSMCRTAHLGTCMLHVWCVWGLPCRRVLDSLDSLEQQEPLQQERPVFAQTYAAAPKAPGHQRQCAHTTDVAKSVQRQI